MNKTLLSLILVVVFSVGSILYYAFKVKPDSQEVFISFAHMGDIHGQLLPRIRIKEGEKRYYEGGLAKLYTIVNHLRERDSQMILINTGDTIHGSAEALFTKGEAVVKILNKFGINYYAPGNWDWVYGKERFEELFINEKPIAPWNPLIANIYDTTTGKPIAAPFKIQTIRGVKVGFIGFSAKPSSIDNTMIKDIRFSDAQAEYKKYVTQLRPQVDVLVVISELGLARNIELAKETAGVDFIFSSGMHEETPEAIRLANGTLIMEEGSDGTRLGELNILIKKGKLMGHKFKMHIVDRNVPDNKEISGLIEELRQPFLDKQNAKKFINPFTAHHLQGPLDSIVGETEVALSRANYSESSMPAVIEGSSHNFVTDAFRIQSGADIAMIPGFRHGTNVVKGPIYREDLYHFIPTGAFVTMKKLSGEKIKKILENSADATFAKSSKNWKDGWISGFSGLHFNLNTYDLKGARISKVTVLDKKTNSYLPLQMHKMYTIASYQYDKDATIDAIEMLEDYLKNHTAKPELNRITLDNKLPAYKYGNKEVQPLP